MRPRTCRARFVYTPVAGTVLNAGAGQTLSVTFTPTDAANYTTRDDDDVTINVLKATPTITGRRRPTSPTARR